MGVCMYDDRLSELTYPWRDRELFKNYYHDTDMTLRDIADGFGCSADTITRWVHRHDLEPRNPKKGEHLVDHLGPAGYSMHPSGYCYATNTYKGERNAVQVHRLLAVAMWGVDAVSGGVVHHKNGIPWDNRPSNLELFNSQADHLREHAGGDSNRNPNFVKNAPWHDRETLRRLYVDEGMTFEEIGDKFDTHQSVIGRWVRKFDIETRRTGPRHR